MKNYDGLIWKRIYRSGKVCSADLEKILNVSNVHASRLISEFRSNNSDKVHKIGRYLFLYPQETPPESILNDSLINEISVAVNQPIISGLFDDELPIVQSSFSHNKKLNGFLATLIRAIKNSRSIEAVYVSLTYKNSPTEKEPPRTLFPVSFRFFDGMWYLIAVDIKKGGEDILKMFALSRFQYIGISENKYRPKNIDDKKKVRFLLTFNSAFTQDQKNIIIDELGLESYDNVRYFIDIFEYEKFSFKRKYLSEDKPSIDSKSIYPFFTSYSEQVI